MSDKGGVLRQCSQELQRVGGIYTGNTLPKSIVDLVASWSLTVIQGAPVVTEAGQIRTAPAELDEPGAEVSDTAHKKLPTSPPVPS